MGFGQTCLAQKRRWAWFGFHAVIFLTWEDWIVFNDAKGLIVCGVVVLIVGTVMLVTEPVRSYERS